MIELRWVARKKWMAYIVGPGGEMGKMVDDNILQFREGDYPYQPPHDKAWVGTDWTDVPTVTEGEG